jgi:hypothetical protein
MFRRNAAIDEFRKNQSLHVLTVIPQTYRDPGAPQSTYKLASVPISGICRIPFEACT